MSTRLAATLGVTLLLSCLIWAAGADAARAPTQQERAELVEATNRSHDVNPEIEFKLVRVLVSSNGAWARAGIKATNRENVQGATGIYHRQARWKLVRLGDEFCAGPILSRLLGMPRAVQREFFKPCP